LDDKIHFVTEVLGFQLQLKSSAKITHLKAKNKKMLKITHI